MMKHSEWQPFGDGVMLLGHETVVPPGKGGCRIEIAPTKEECEALLKTLRGLKMDIHRAVKS